MAQQGFILEIVRGTEDFGAKLPLVPTHLEFDFFHPFSTRTSPTIPVAPFLSPPSSPFLTTPRCSLRRPHPSVSDTGALQHSTGVRGGGEERNGEVEA